MTWRAKPQQPMLGEDFSRFDWQKTLPPAPVRAKDKLPAAPEPQPQRFTRQARRDGWAPNQTLDQTEWAKQWRLKSEIAAAVLAGESYESARARLMRMIWPEWFTGE